MKIIFMGTSNFAVYILKILIKYKYNIKIVVTQPDKSGYRGNKKIINPIKKIALKHNILIYQKQNINNNKFIVYIKNIFPDIIIVVAFGQLISKKILNIPKFGCINIHASLLPLYKGAAPIQWSIINGEKITGITIIHMNEYYDCGEIISKIRININKKETYGSLLNKLSILGGKLCIKVIKNIINNNKLFFKKQKNINNIKYAIKINKKNSIINWKLSASYISQFIRGLNPKPIAYTFINNKLLKLWNVEVINKNIKKYNNSIPGEILAITNNGILIKTIKNFLLLKELQLEGKKKMNYKKFLLGNNKIIKIGCILKNKIFNK